MGAAGGYLHLRSLVHGRPRGVLRAGCSHDAVAFCPQGTEEQVWAVNEIELPRSNGSCDEEEEVSGGLALSRMSCLQ